MSSSRKRSARTMGGGDRGDEDPESRITTFKDSLLDHADQTRQNSSAWCSRLSVKCALDGSVLRRLDVVVEQLAALRGEDVEAERKAAKKSRAEKCTVSQKQVLLARVLACRFFLAPAHQQNVLPGRVAPPCEGALLPSLPPVSRKVGCGQRCLRLHPSLFRGGLSSSFSRHFPPTPMRVPACARTP